MPYLPSGWTKSILSSIIILILYIQYDNKIRIKIYNLNQIE